MTAEQRRLSEDIERESPRLRGFIRRRVPNEADVEDILQDVFSELMEAYRLMQPIEHVGAWLFRVARNRITDLFRRRRTEVRVDAPEAEGEEDEMPELERFLPDVDASPESAYLRELLLEELEAALNELPAEQQEVFIAHEFEGKNFKMLAEETGESMNTLLSRKHYAVRHLRKRLRALYDEFNET